MAEIIVTTLNGRVDPADMTVSELFERKNFAQALSNINRRLKKNSNDRLLVNKAIVLDAFEDDQQRKEAFKIVAEVAGHELAYLDKEILLAVDNFASRPVSPEYLQKQALALWEKALKAPSFDDDTALELYESKILSVNYNLAQKIAQTRMKKNRSWRVRYVVAVHLAAYSKRSQSPNKAVLGTLACRILEMDVKNAMASESRARALLESRPGSSTPCDVLTGHEELLLATTIFSKHAHHQKIAEIYDELTRLVGYDAKARGLVKQKFRSLAQIEDWRGLWQSCYHLLLSRSPSTEVRKDDNQCGDTVSGIDTVLGDWEIWKLLAEAVFYLGSEQVGAMFKDLVEAYSTRTSTWRVVNLAHIHLESLNCKNNQTGSLSLLGKLSLEFFKQQADKPMCFTDLKVAQLMGLENYVFLENASYYSLKLSNELLTTKRSRRTWLCSEINSLKQDYYRLVSTERSKMSTSLLNKFATNSFRLYIISQKLELNANISDSVSLEKEYGVAERRLGDDAAILTVFSLLHLANLQHPSAYYQAVVLLERVLARSPHNYEARVLAIRTHLRLANTRRAIELFRKLDVKNIQHLSISWIIITRLSTLTPHERDTQDLLDDVVASNFKLVRLYSKTASQFLKESTWGSLLQYIEEFECLEHTVSTCLGYGELSTCNLLSEREAVYKPQRHQPVQSNRFENRDSSPFRSYASEEGEQTIEECIQLGPKPQTSWATMRLQSQDLLSLMAGRLQYKVQTGFESVWTSSHLDQMYKSNASPVENLDMTASESRLSLLHYRVYLLINSCVTDSTRDKNALASTTLMVSCFKGILETSITYTASLSVWLMEASSLDWYAFHDHFIHFEALHIILILIRYLSLEESHIKRRVGFEEGWLANIVAEYKNKLVPLLEKDTDAADYWIERLGSNEALDTDLREISSSHAGDNELVAFLLMEGNDTPAGTSIREVLLDYRRGLRRSLAGIKKSTQILTEEFKCL